MAPYLAGLVTLNDMKAKQEALVKEREKQLAKKEQSKELQLWVLSQHAALPSTCSWGLAAVRHCLHLGGVTLCCNQSPVCELEVTQSSRTHLGLCRVGLTLSTQAALGPPRGLRVGMWCIMAPMPWQETGEAAREGPQEGGRAKDLQPVLHPGGRVGGRRGGGRGGPVRGGAGEGR